MRGSAGLSHRPWEAALRILHELRAIGVRVALDDFGTGYSSLGYLRRFPFDRIKIDRSFINGLTDKDASCGIVRAVVAIASEYNMATTAEGVETEEQREMLRQLDCSEMQGFLFSRPIASPQLRDLLQGRQEQLACSTAQWQLGRLLSEPNAMIEQSRRILALLQGAERRETIA